MVTFRSDIKVELIHQYGEDKHIAEAAWVSSGKELAEDTSEKRIGGLVRSLLRQKHGCYDDQTEVLTNKGWVRWPDATIEHQYATLNLETDQIEYQKPTHLIQKDVDENLIRFRKEGLDLLVTEDHRMIVSLHEDRETWGRWHLTPAHTLYDTPHRMRLGGGTWRGFNNYSADFWALMGFALGDGTITPHSVTFHLRKQRKIDWLIHTCEKLGYTINQNNDRFSIKTIEAFRNIGRRTYDEQKNRVIPRQVLDLDRDYLESFWNGLVEADGYVTPSGKTVVTTVSETLAGQLQEVLLKLGKSARIRVNEQRDTSFGIRPLYVITVVRDRKSCPRLNWTKTDQHLDMQPEHYKGTIYCVTVPNGTLYVRRNNKAVWCGNTPFEAGYFAWHVEAPRAVRDEAVRHRIASFSSSSLRYTLASPEVYIPSRERPFKKVEGFKQMRPEYEPLNDTEYAAYIYHLKQGYSLAQRDNKMIQALIDSTEAARWLTHDGTYVKFHIRLNPRSVMHFLGLRTHNEGANHVSYPMWEIERMALSMEKDFAEKLPITYAAWNENGREAP